QVRAGKLQPSVSLERDQSRDQNFFLELAYPATLVPNRDVGVELQGKLADGRLAYALGLYDGTVDGGSTNANADGELELATRLHWRPLAARENGDDLGFGLAGTWGDRGGSPAPYRTVGQQPLFAWAEGVVA